ncbi:hypothetical protein SAMN05421752_102441 [Natronorubrum thiooxidans]|uniref:Uncharacterized protein n=1 Tax=Natronorubrum thiooxidans TaxID=308853 RepID=A0A1N7DQS7_9EURY|nr:hypothetical protein SAMN05421752_102441 [Natronorubrum thiooxidans]
MHNGLLSLWLDAAAYWFAVAPELTDSKLSQM